MRIIIRPALVLSLFLFVTSRPFCQRQMRADDFDPGAFDSFKFLDKYGSLLFSDLNEKGHISYSNKYELLS